MTQIQIRRDTSTNWTKKNPTPAAGEPCFETDTGKFKIGDGTTAYNDLKYQTITNADVVDDTEVVGNKSWSSSKVNAELQAIAGEVVDKQEKLYAGSAISMDNNEVAVKLYDSSKFTVVGSPTITEDGIASGFSGVDYIETPSLKLENNIITINAKIKNAEITNLNYGFFYSPLNYKGGIHLWRVNASLMVRFYTGDKNSLTSTDIQILSDLETEKYYNVKISCKNKEVSIKTTKEDGTEYNTNKTLAEDIYFPEPTPYLIGARFLDKKPQEGAIGSIDLKSFSITVDSEEVFNGSKTIYTALDDKAQVTDLDTKASISLDNLTDAGKQVIKDMIPTTDIATTSSVGTVKPDGSTITITSDGTISAASSTPTNMVTTDTQQTISAAKDFNSSCNFNNGCKFNSSTYSSNYFKKGFTVGDINIYNSSGSILRIGSSTTSYLTMNNNVLSFYSSSSTPGMNITDGTITGGYNKPYLKIKEYSDNSNTHNLEISCDTDNDNTWNIACGEQTFINTSNIDTTYMKWDNTDNKLKVDTAAVAHLAFPSSTSVSLTLGASGTTYTAPADGYFSIFLEATTAGGWTYVAVNDLIREQRSGFGADYICTTTVPIKNGDSMYFSYLNVEGRTNPICFIYAVGTVPTA